MVCGGTKTDLHGNWGCMLLLPSHYAQQSVSGLVTLQ